MFRLCRGFCGETTCDNNSALGTVINYHEGRRCCHEGDHYRRLSIMIGKSYSTSSVFYIYILFIYLSYFSLCAAPHPRVDCDNSTRLARFAERQVYGTLSSWRGKYNIIIYYRKMTECPIPQTLLLLLLLLIAAIASGDIVRRPHLSDTDLRRAAPHRTFSSLM